MPFRRLLPLALGLLAVVAAACGGSSGGSPQAQVTPASLHGAIPGCDDAAKCAAPNVALRTTAGETFNIADEAAKKILILYFGYTHCPDECPTTMADLAAALRHSPQWVQDQVQVAFVTTDPRRDTPTVLRHWLDSFSPPQPYVGLTGSTFQISSAESGVNIPLATPEKVTGKDRKKVGAYAVNHFAAAVGYDRSGHVAVLYPAGVSPDDIAKDLPVLVANKVATS